MKRVKDLLAEAEFKEYLENIAVREADRKFCRHDLTHFMDVARICYILWLEAGQPDKGKITKEIIYITALLHDIGRWREYERGGDHALISSDVAHTILERKGFPAAEIEVITQAIFTHRKLTGDETLLGRLLYRADKLSRSCFSCDVKEECHKHHYLKQQDIY